MDRNKNKRDHTVEVVIKKTDSFIIKECITEKKDLPKIGEIIEVIFNQDGSDLTGTCLYKNHKVILDAGNPLPLPRINKKYLTEITYISHRTQICFVIIKQNPISLVSEETNKKITQSLLRERISDIKDVARVEQWEFFIRDINELYQTYYQSIGAATIVEIAQSIPCIYDSISKKYKDMPHAQEQLTAIKKECIGMLLKIEKKITELYNEKKLPVYQIVKIMYAYALLNQEAPAFLYKELVNNIDKLPRDEINKVFASFKILKKPLPPLLIDKYIKLQKQGPAGSPNRMETDVAEYVKKLYPNEKIELRRFMLGFEMDVVLPERKINIECGNPHGGYKKTMRDKVLADAGWKLIRIIKKTKYQKGTWKEFLKTKLDEVLFSIENRPSLC